MLSRISFLHNRRWACEVIEPRDPSAPASSVWWRRGRAALMGNTELGINIHTAALLVMSVCVAKGEGVYGSALKAMVRVMRTMLARVRPCWMTHSITMLHTQNGVRDLERDLTAVSSLLCWALCLILCNVCNVTYKHSVALSFGWDEQNNCLTTSHYICAVVINRLCQG